MASESFDRRRRAEEEKQARAENVRFRAGVKAARDIVKIVAEKIPSKHDVIEEYADQIVSDVYLAKGYQAFIERLLQDAKAAGINDTDTDYLKSKFEDFRNRYAQDL